MIQTQIIVLNDLVIKSCFLQHKQSWKINVCKSCKCYHGEIKCAIEKCSNLINQCPSNSRLVHYRDECCPRCEEMSGVCAVFGDPHYKTFDGNMFSFQGSCKYTLVEDCSKQRSFSIVVKNTARGTSSSAWTKLVILKFKHFKISLGQKNRVKLNKRSIPIPFKMNNTLEIRHTKPDYLIDDKEEFIQLDAYHTLGIKIVWNGVNFLQVTANPKLKNKLCGLCGNYNFFAQDDFKMDNGKVLNQLEVWKFAKSWKIGGKHSCDRTDEHFTRWSMKNKRCLNEISPSNWLGNPCRQLTFSKLFGNCDMILSSRNYLRACLTDMCECKPGSKCYCQSLQAYVIECQRLGADVPITWKQNSYCAANSADMSQIHRRKLKGRKQYKQVFVDNELIRSRRFHRNVARHRKPSLNITSLPIS